MSLISLRLSLPLSYAIHNWWQRLAYRHKSAEFLMYFMLVTGALLWEQFAINWQFTRVALFSHMFLGATAFTLIVGAFWSSHRQLLRRSNKPFLRQTGAFIEWLLFSCTLSGFYLFFFGHTGNTLSNLIQNIHFYTSWLLAPLVFRHAMRWSIINIKRHFT